MAVGLAAIIAACGSPAPQAPAPEASRLSDSLTSIAKDCGEAYQRREFAVSPPPLSRLEADAKSRVDVLSNVFRRNPEWIFQGATVRQLVALTRDYLRACDLRGAATRLTRETR
jgi:hypothetical protein